MSNAIYRIQRCNWKRACKTLRRFDLVSVKNAIEIAIRARVSGVGEADGRGDWVKAAQGFPTGVYLDSARPKTKVIGFGRRSKLVLYDAFRLDLFRLL